MNTPTLPPATVPPPKPQPPKAVKRPKGGARSIPIENWEYADFGGVFDGNSVWSETDLGGAFSHAAIN